MKYLSFIVGFMKTLFNPRISCLALITADCIIDKRATIHRWAKVKRSSIGAYTYISNNTIVDNVEMGKFCSIADNIRIGLPSHNPSLLSISPLFTIKRNAVKTSWVEQDFNDFESQRTVIGHDVWIASHALVMGGLSIGNGAIVAAGAVVTKDVPPYAVVGGVPAKIIKYRFEPEVIEQLEALQWWNLPDDVLRKHLSAFQTEDILQALALLESR